MIHQVTIDDVQMANMALDAWHAAEDRATEKARKQAEADAKNRGTHR